MATIDVMMQAPEHRRGRVSHNLFFALWPDDAVRSRIETAARTLQTAHAARGRWIRPQRYHLTLRYLGEHANLPGDLLAAARAAGEAARARAFDLVLDRAGSFANRSVPWWLGCSTVPAELSELFDGITTGLGSRGHATSDEAHLVAHVTVLRDADRRLPTTAIAPIEWRVDAFALIDSELGAEPSYTILERWPLTAKV